MVGVEGKAKVARLVGSRSCEGEEMLAVECLVEDEVGEELR